MDAPTFAVRYLSLDGTEHIDGGITQTVLDKMVRMIRSGTVCAVCLSMSEYGEIGRASCRERVGLYV